MRPVDLPPAERYPHGKRARYVAGCRCDECRKANREYAKARERKQNKGEWNGLVPAGPVRKHILAVTKDALNDAKLLDPVDLLERLEALRVAHGWTKTERARRMGFKSRTVQFRKHAMTAKSVRRVERFIRNNPPPAPVEDRHEEAPSGLPFFLRIHAERA